MLLPESLAPGQQIPVSTAASGNGADRFYKHFVDEYLVFSGSIQGIPVQTDKDGKPISGDRERYALLTMNRLVFLAFLQKKGFLNGDRNYLQTYLEGCRCWMALCTSYQSFLSMLFRDGLNAPSPSPGLEQELGKLPYLKIDLFDQHPLERTYQGIQIPNSAFETLLQFFAKYHWQLDDGVAQGGNDITPETFSTTLQHLATDKEKGVYYTKKDITEYISKNAIIPSLFDELQRKHPEAFSPESFRLVIVA